MSLAAKRKREDVAEEVEEEAHVENGHADFGDEEIDLALLEQAEKDAQVVEALDTRGVKRLVLSFERKLKENLEARMKYVDQPEKFVESEIELDEEVKKLHALSAVPELYPELVRLQTVPSILSLLSHENTDISIDVVDLLRELTDPDAVGDSEEEARTLLDALVENNALELVVQNLARLDESVPDEATAVFNSLGIIENLAEANSQVAELVCEKTKLLRWLLGRLKGRDFDSNKLYASEILAILMQQSTANQRRLGQQEGLDALLKAVAAFKSRDPRTSDEEEMLENLYNTLCSALMPAENKERFVKSEGVELMIIIIKQKRQAYFSALKTLDFALTRCASACERFVDVLGLKTLFAVFMGKTHVKLKRTEVTEEEVDERAISLVANLFSGLSRGTRRDRVLSKFVENEFEKIDRCLELFMRYLNRVMAEEERQGKIPPDLLEDMDQDELYFAKLEAGLFTLQLLALILGHIWAAEHRGMRERILLLLHQNALGIDVVRDILVEFHDNIGDTDGSEERERRRAKIKKLITALTPKDEE